MHACGTDWWRISTRRVTKASFPPSLADKSCQPQPALKASFLSPTRTQRQKRRRQRRLRSEKSLPPPPSFALARAGRQAATEVDNKGRKLRWGRGECVSLHLCMESSLAPFFPLPPPPCGGVANLRSLSYALGREKSLRSSGGGEESLLLREGRKKTFAKFGTRTGEGG